MNAYQDFRRLFSVSIFALVLATQGLATSVAHGAPGSPAENGNAGVSPLYTGNREPLVPSPFIKLPIGCITPNGWLRAQLELEAQGMIGHLSEISKWCKFEGNAWADPQGQGHSGWEELPYWLKGYGDLGYVLKDEAIIKSARRWIDAVLASQEPSGWFGPRSLKSSLEGKPDLWPHMVMCNVLQSFYEYAEDPRVLPFLTRYFKFLDSQPGQNFAAGYWPKIRFGDSIESIYWLYNRTGQPWLLELAEKIHFNMAHWENGVINWHNVNIAQGFREPGVYYQQAKAARFLQAAETNYNTVMARYGQFPGGGFAGDENCRPGFTDPRQGFETCGMVEFMHSFEMLTKISGDSIWSDRCEEIAFNSLPAALTPDLKALHYLTSPNQVLLDRKNKSPGVENEGTMFSYSPYEVYRCCQHNVSHGWPYFAEELWLATADRGLCASLYSTSEVTAKVAKGSDVKITEETNYPFDDTIKLKISTPESIAFPLYLRIPRWCEAPEAKINGAAVPGSARPGPYLILNQQWRDGDTITLRLPMRITVRTWEQNQNAVSVHYGPLAFSLKIGEQWSRYGGKEGWPESEVAPTTPWNYGLVLKDGAAADSFELIKRPGPLAAQPFTPEATPIELRAKARQIAAWKQDARGLVGKLQPSPVKSEEPLESVTLIPMGAARLRITTFPVIGSGKEAHMWIAPKPLPVSASHCFERDTLEALIDGKEPKSSNDHTIPRFTWWDHRGTSEWVQYDFEKPRRVSAIEVYWFDDTGAGDCRVPQSCKVLYKDGENWKEVRNVSDLGTKPDAYNRAKFEPVRTTALKIEVKLQPNFSGGILEWKVK